MDNNQIQGNQEEIQTPPQAEEVNQPEPMPSSEQKQTDENSQEPSDQGNTESLPNEVSERTRRQFEKLLEENRRLKAEKQTSYGKSVFDSFHPQQQGGEYQQVVDANNYSSLNQNQVNAIAQQFVDQDGNVDINGLNQALVGANRRAQQAEMQVKNLNDRITRFEENQQVREAHAVHAELDPESEKFDSEFFDLVRDRLLRNMYEGKNQTLLEVANAIRKKYQAPQPVNLDKVKEEAVTQYKQTQVSRQQGPIESGKGSPRNESTLDELRERTRRGDPQAIEERLRNLGVIKSST